MLIQNLKLFQNPSIFWKNLKISYSRILEKFKNLNQGFGKVFKFHLNVTAKISSEKNSNFFYKQSAQEIL